MHLWCRFCNLYCCSEAQSCGRSCRQAWMHQTLRCTRVHGNGTSTTRYPQSITLCKLTATTSLLMKRALCIQLRRVVLHYLEMQTCKKRPLLWAWNPEINLNCVKHSVFSFLVHTKSSLWLWASCSQSCSFCICTNTEKVLLQCTMCTLYSISISQLNKLQSPLGKVTKEEKP